MDDRKPNAVSVLVSWGRQHPRSILVFATLACLLPFLDKAVHIDDPLFLWVGQQMQTRWWDPYGFDVNWYGWSMPMHEVTKNPPLASAYIAFIISLFGGNEIALHLGFFLAAIAAVLGTHALARRLCEHALPAALGVLFTPVFLVSSTTLMCDVLMVALWVWAVEFWIRGLENDRPALLIIAAFFVAACSLAKYFGIALLPLLLVYSIARKQKSIWWLICLVIPALIIGVYECLTRTLYGHGLILGAFSYASENQAQTASSIFLKLITGFGFVGGCCAIVLAFLPILWRQRFWIGLTVIALGLIFVRWIVPNSTLMGSNIPSDFGITSLWIILILVGLGILSFPITDWIRHKSPEALLLLLWVWGTFMFCILNWTINGRSVLPMAPAVSILLLRQIESIKGIVTLRLNWRLGAAAALALIVSFADYRLANSAREAVAEIQSRFGNFAARPIRFQGHWGFQYYAQLAGWHPYDVINQQSNPGDFIVLPFTNTNMKPISENTVERIALIEVPVTPWIATMNKAVGAGFYMDILGPLPFGFGPVAPEKYYVLRFK